MSHLFRSFDEYFQTEPQVSVRSNDVGGVIVSRLEETSNDISVASVGMDSVLVSLSGSAYHNVSFGGVRREAPAAVLDVALVPKGVALQSSWRVRAGKLQTLSLEFGADLFERFTPELVSDRFAGGHLIPANYGRRGGLAGIAQLLMREMTPETARGPLFSDSANRLLALELAVTWWSVPGRLPSQVQRPDRRVRRAIDYIEANLSETISMLDIADAAGLGISGLTSQFRRQTGRSPYAYVVERRVALAEKLLRTSDLSLAEVALAAGFSDQSHLCRHIRAHRGMTPRQLRERG